jgi:hypothetical protein
MLVVLAHAHKNKTTSACRVHAQAIPMLLLKVTLFSAFCKSTKKVLLQPSITRQYSHNMDGVHVFAHEIIS